MQQKSGFMIDNMSELLLFINGKKVVIENADPALTLIEFLRRERRLTGTKLGCSEGGCGACTVMVSRYNRNTQKILHYSVNACLAPLVSLHGLSVTTVEGIGSTKTRVHAIQERLASSHGTQCGFCTPGIVMSMYTLLRNNPQPTQTEMENAFDGNLCRCTGYRPILEGFKSFAKEGGCGLGAACCRNQENENSCGDKSEQEETEDTSECNNLYDPTQEPIFPPQLKLTDYDSEKLEFQGENVRWIRPTNLQSLLELKKQHPEAKLVCGNTEVGVNMKFKNQRYSLMIAPTYIPELLEITPSSSGLTIGASCTLTQLDEILKEQISELPSHATRIYSEIVEILRWFAGHQIRNVSSIAGNVMAMNYVSDLKTLYAAAGVRITVQSSDRGTREIVFDENFLDSVSPDEVLINIHIPTTRHMEYFGGYKQAHRKGNDVATVNCGARVLLKSLEQPVIEEFSLSYGGMAPITVVCTKTAHQLIGRQWDDSVLNDVDSLISSDTPLVDSAPGGMISYRKSLTLGFFFKFYNKIKNEILQTQGSTLPAPLLSSITPLERSDTRGVQVFDESPTKSVGDCGKPLRHKTGLQQCTGEAQYIDDIPHIAGELYLSLVFSSVPHARIQNIDTSAALQSAGVVDYISAKDVVGSNTYRFTNDERIFSHELVECQGQIIGAILADTQRHAQAAAKLVKMEYDELPSIFTIEQAIEAESYLSNGEKKLWKGDVDEAFSRSDLVFTGETRTGCQEHFYLETQAVLCVPNECGEMEVFSSTQGSTEIQSFVSSALNVPAHKINVRGKRIGGGFGGKGTRAAILTLPVAIAANKHGVPVRCMFDRDEDMISTGGRHSFLTKYKVGVNTDGRIQAIDSKSYSNGGCTHDLSVIIIEKVLLSLDNVYCIPNMKLQGFVCKTNTPSNTAMRGLGAPHAMLCMENIINEISHKLSIDENKLREMHFYKEGELTHYGQPVINCTMNNCWSQVLERSNYYQRLEEVNKYNQSNRYRKRGISSIPTKYGISFTLPLLNQAGALVQIYTDGSVLLAHGGNEMGQGLHTKMIQVASTALGIPSDLIHVMETSTATVPNTSHTSASTATDLNGMAVLRACEELNGRLEPIKKQLPDAAWQQWISIAYFQRISLSATGYYATPDLSMDWTTSTGTPYSYFTYGAAVSEVEIDCLTGDHQVLRTDIVMDVGKSLNPAVDIGQIEGAFVQGYGHFCLEQLKIQKDSGVRLTRGPGTYKIPGFRNIPQEFNVTLLKDVPNVKAIYSSKGVGEPPLFLSSSVFFAIKSAIYSARHDAGDESSLELFTPCTPERIRMSCTDHIIKKVGQTGSARVPEQSFFIEP